jgi:ssDNA-binding replication factor A large subunit
MTPSLVFVGGSLKVMVKIPLNDIISKIVEKAGISEDEVKKRIDAKLVQLAGLISQEGAAQIIANEMGVKLIQSNGRLQVKNVLAGLRSVEVAGKVLRIYEAREFNTGTRKGKVGSFFMGDETGNIRVTLWNDQSDNLRKLKEGDTVLIKEAYVRENNGRKEVHLNDKSDIRINPAGVAVGEVKPLGGAPQADKKQIKDLKEGDVNVELLATVVQVFTPNFFEVCPDCGKRALDNKCPDHGAVTPANAYVANVVLDDGTGNVRTAFYRNQLLRLLNVDEAKLLAVKGNPESFEEIKKPLLPKVIKVIGRTKTNPLSNALEFTANLVFTDVDPKKEVAALKAELGK